LEEGGGERKYVPTPSATKRKKTRKSDKGDGNSGRCLKVVIVLEWRMNTHQQKTRLGQGKKKRRQKKEEEGKKKKISLGDWGGIRMMGVWEQNIGKEMKT